MAVRLPRFAVRRVLIYTHRWLGIAGGLLFIAWFGSGLVMMYERLPRLSPEERLARLAALDLSNLAASPVDAAQSIGFHPDRLRVGMLGQRPVYRFARGGEWSAVFADDGRLLNGLTGEQAMMLARQFSPEFADSARYDTHLADADQWTLTVRALTPVHRIALGDSDDTYLYVSDRTGEVVMKTTSWGRIWGYLGSVLHWLYFTPFRRHSALWINSVIALSIAGCLLSLSGLVWGIWRLSMKTRYRVKGNPARSPYAGLMRWHHYAGLIFGLTTFTWILSGCLSLDPWSWHPGTTPTREQTEAVAGGPLRLELLTPERIRLAADAIASSAEAGASSFVPKELEAMQFRAEPFFVAYRAPSADSPAAHPRAGAGAFLSPVQALEHLAVSAVEPERGTFTRFADNDVLAAARAAMPDSAVEDAEWIEDYDDYYYSRDRALPLPVLRLRFDDPQRTWLYVDPYRGLILRKEERLTRLNRWLYHGLHNLDFRFLYYRRPLWDIVVIVLLIGGIVLSASSMVQAWHRLRRHTRRLTGGRTTGRPGCAT